MGKCNKKFYLFLSHAGKQTCFFFFWILCLHENTLLYGEESFALTFLELEKASEYHNQQIHIRGFLYQKKNGDWILAKEPHLKTCCVGSKEKRSEQIAIYGDLTAEHPKHAVTVEGLFFAEPKWDHEGRRIGTFFHLEEGKILPEQNSKGSVILIALITATMGFVLLFFLSRLRNR